MFRKYQLPPLTVHDSMLDFEWDADAGVVRGADARRVESLLAGAVAAGGVVGDPYPSFYPVTKPLVDRAQMAVVLGQFWKLSDDLAASYPSAEGQPPDLVEITDDRGEIPVDIQVIH